MQFKNTARLPYFHTTIAVLPAIGAHILVVAFLLPRYVATGQELEFVHIPF